MDKEFFIRPFPINFSTDELSDYYFTKNKNEEAGYISIISSDNLEDLKEYYFKICDFFIRSNFKKGCFAALHNGYDFFKLLVKNKTIGETINELNFDFTHFLDMKHEELQLILIPFEDEIEMDYFGYIIRKYNIVEYWKNGEKIESNAKYFKK